MTSCDENIVKYILPQLVSIDKNLRAYDVHFYLAHSRISDENIEILQRFAKTLQLSFCAIEVTDTLLYETLAASVGWQWPAEAYFTLRVQDYLPDDVDRVLYIDAGDVIIDGDISYYYFDDFEGNSIIATAYRYKTNPSTNKYEMYTGDDVLEVAKRSYFNSGSYMLNVEKFREECYSVDDYIHLMAVLVGNAGFGEMAYYGDQGFLAAAFVGDVKIFCYPEVRNPAYMPYNFLSSYWGMFGKEPFYNPVIIHYAIIAKPWVVRFSEEEIATVIGNPNFVRNHMVLSIPPLAYVTPQHCRLCETWWHYAKNTPIYEEASAKARHFAECWLKFYFPLCEAYTNVGYKLRELE